MNDYALYVLPWMWIGGWIGATIYRDLKEQFPWQWFQGQVKARAVVLAVMVGILWPGSLILAAMSQFPNLRRWLTAFIEWRRPVTETLTTSKNRPDDDQR